jgi:sugar phosphate isomerase/epimerase
MAQSPAEHDMKIGGAHLTYCTNIHRGETWGETRAALERHLPDVKRKVSPDADMGVGLRLSGIASEELGMGAQFQAFKEFLATQGLYVFTINGFPYGPFHGTRVKEEVYQPDWRFAERLSYSNRMADQLAALLPADPALDGSISTVPATFRPIGTAAGALDQISENLLQHAAHLVEVKARTGRTITIALEPEPMCYLETSGELISFMQERIFSRAATQRFSQISGIAAARAEAALRRHVGICYDVCHAAIEFEGPADSIAQLRRAGIGIFKLQLSAALKEPRVDAATVARLSRFDEGVYLHQVVERRGDGSLVRYLDLAPAFEKINRAYGSEWRVHCHVPVFMDKLPELETTQDFLRAILALHGQSAISPHLEVETYTFDVLPEELRRVDVATAVARELAWVKDRLDS